MKIHELRKFAITLGLLPWIPAFVLYKHSYAKFALYVLVLFLALSLFCFLSKTFAEKFKALLSVICGFLGKYLAILVLLLGYIIAVIPTGILMKIVKRDRLRLKKPNIDSYWINHENKTTDYEYQF